VHLQVTLPASELDDRDRVHGGIEVVVIVAILGNVLAVDVRVGRVFVPTSTMLAAECRRELFTAGRRVRH
jgi:hypothetical protein